jgi:hypothetical protein
VGDRVKLKPGCDGGCLSTEAEIGEIAEDDGSSIPYKVLNRATNATWWYSHDRLISADGPCVHSPPANANTGPAPAGGGAAQPALVPGTRRPRVGESVKLSTDRNEGCLRAGEIGTLAVDDGSSVPFQVRGPRGDTYWFNATDIVLMEPAASARPAAAPAASGGGCRNQ